MRFLLETKNFSLPKPVVSPIRYTQNHTKTNQLFFFSAQQPERESRLNGDANIVWFLLSGYCTKANQFCNEYYITFLQFQIMGSVSSLSINFGKDLLIYRQTHTGQFSLELVKQNFWTQAMDQTKRQLWDFYNCVFLQ